MGKREDTEVQEELVHNSEDAKGWCVGMQEGREIGTGTDECKGGSESV